MVMTLYGAGLLLGGMILAHLVGKRLRRSGEEQW